MRKPLIGLTPSHDTEKGDISMRPTYLKAIQAAGGIPIVLPLTPSKEDLLQLTNSLDGFLFTGGPDIHAFYFGEQTHAGCGNVSPARDTLELALLPLVMGMKKPVLGICRGIQVLNIALGGDIYQDLPSQFHEDFPVAHKQPFYYNIPSHTVDVVPGTLLSQICQTNLLKVNSMHHQAVRKVAPGLIACGHAPGGLVEALEKPDYPYFLGVQWHPEYLWEQDAAAARLFSSFVKACCAEL